MGYEIRPVDELSHHGILGQKWGIRRYQYKDGSLTEEGRKRYGSLKESISKWGVRMKEKGAEAKQYYEERKENKKHRLIEKGTPKQIQKNIKMFNADELSVIEKRFSTELRVHDEIERLSNSKKSNTPVSSIDPAKQFTNATSFISNNTKNAESSISSAVKAYNNIARAHNALRPNKPAMKLIPEKEEKNQNNPSGGGSP